MPDQSNKDDQSALHSLSNSSQTSDPATEESEREALILESFFDGELSVRDSGAVEEQIAADPRLRYEIDSLRHVRQEFREYFLEQSRLAARRVDLWSAISAEISQPAPSRFPWIESVSQFLRAPGPSRGAFAAITLCCLMLVSFQLGTHFGANDESGSQLNLASSDDSSLSGIESEGVDFASAGSEEPRSYYATRGPLFEQFPANVAQRTVASHGASSGDETFAPAAGSEVYLGPTGRDGSSPEVERRAGARSGGQSGMALRFSLMAKGPRGEVRQFEGLVPVPRSYAGPLENRRDFMRSGMKTPGADIDWIRSDKSFRIFPSSSATHPPVIWVARDEPTTNK